jgi:hypothetical protein
VCEDGDDVFLGKVGLSPTYTASQSGTLYWLQSYDQLLRNAYEIQTLIERLNMDYLLFGPEMNDGENE